MSDSIQVQLTKILDDYAEDVRRQAEQEMQTVARATANRLKQTSPKGRGKNKRYAQGWATKKEGKDIVVYNRTKWMLTHLLERGHAKVNGGRVPGRAHIEPAREWAQGEVIRRVESKL